MKIKSGLLAAAILFQCSVSILFAQQTTFTKVYYDPAGAAQAYAIVKTADQDYMIAGEKDNAALILKADPSGNILWSKRFANLDDSRFHGITATHDGGFMMTGRVYDTVAGWYNILCVKINSAGDTLWMRSVNMGNNSSALSVSETKFHGFIISGYLQQAVMPYTLMVVVKLDSVGNKAWSRTLDAANNNNTAYSVKQTPDEGFLVFGDMESYPPFEQKAAMIKLTANGEFSWAKKQLLAFPVNSMGWDVTVTNSGFMFLLSSSTFGVAMMKTDFSGNVLWSHKYDVGYSDFFTQFPRPHLVGTSDSGFIFSSSGYGYDPMIKTDSLGIPQWEKMLTFMNSDVVESSDNGFLALGNGPLMGVKMAPTNNPQIGLIKLDAAGNFTGCVVENPITSDIFTISLIPVTFTATSAGTISGLYGPASGAALSVFEGCVAVTGGSGETDPEQNAFSVSPNPSDGHFRVTNLQAAGQPILGVRITNAMGREIYTSPGSTTEEFPVDLTRQPDGMYFIRAIYHDRIITRKILVRH